MLYLSCEKNENKQKESGFGPFFYNQNQISYHLPNQRFAVPIPAQVANFFTMTMTIEMTKKRKRSEMDSVT